MMNIGLAPNLNSGYFIQIIENFVMLFLYFPTVQIQIRGLLQDPAYLDLNCLKI